MVLNAIPVVDIFLFYICNEWLISSSARVYVFKSISKSCTSKAMYAKVFKSIQKYTKICLSRQRSEILCKKGNFLKS